jgi:hypothetical protein
VVKRAAFRPQLLSAYLGSNPNSRIHGRRPCQFAISELCVRRQLAGQVIIVFELLENFF